MSKTFMPLIRLGYEGREGNSLAANHSPAWEGLQRAGCPRSKSANSSAAGREGSAGRPTRGRGCSAVQESPPGWAVWEGRGGRQRGTLGGSWRRSQDSLGCRASFPQPRESESTVVLLCVTAHSSLHMPLPSPTPAAVPLAPRSEEPALGFRLHGHHPEMFSF